MLFNEMHSPMEFHCFPRAFPLDQNRWKSVGRLALVLINHVIGSALDVVNHFTGIAALMVMDNVVGKPTSPTRLDTATITAVN